MASRSAAIAFALVLSVASSAHAAPTAAQRETARRLMDEGKQKTKANDLAGALDAYQKAFDLIHVPTTGLALARAHVAVGHLVEARDVALEVTRMSPEPGEPPVFEQSRKAAKELEASLKPRIPTVTIVVKGGPATSVALDGVEVTSSVLGAPFAVNPGKRAVVVKNADGVEGRGEVELAEKQAKDLEIALPAPKGQDKTTTTTPITEPPSDEHTERTPLANVLVFGGFGLAVAGIAAGSVTGVMASSSASDVKPQCANNICDPAAKGDLDHAKSMATMSTIGFAVAGAGVVLGAVGLLLPKQRVSKNTAIWIGPGSVGLGGSF